jgi:hypothetical protein
LYSVLIHMISYIEIYMMIYMKFIWNLYEIYIEIYTLFMVSMLGQYA